MSVADRVIVMRKGRVIESGRPEDLYDRLFAQGMRPGSILTARVEVKESMGADLCLYLRAGGLSLHARMNPATKVEVGGTLDVYADLGKMHLFDKETGEAII